MDHASGIFKNKRRLAPEVSGMEFARDPLVGTQTSANVKYYAENRKRKSVLRSLIKLNEETANACYLENEPLDELLERTGEASV